MAPSFVSSPLVWLVIARSRASSLSFTSPSSVPRACEIRSSSFFSSANPFFTAVSIRPSFDERLVVWLPIARSIAAIFSPREVPAPSIAWRIRSCACLTSVTPLLTAASIRSSFISRLFVWSDTAFSIADSFDDRLPFIDSIALRISSSASSPATLFPAAASATASSFVSRLTVWLSMAASRAASLSSTLPVSESSAVLISS